MWDKVTYLSEKLSKIGWNNNNVSLIWHISAKAKKEKGKIPEDPESNNWLNLDRNKGEIHSIAKGIAKIPK